MFDELRRRFGAPSRPPPGEPDPWREVRASEAWTHGFVLAFAPDATVEQVNDFLDGERPSVPRARLETSFRDRAIRVALPPGSSVDDHLAWVDLLEATGLFVPPADT